MTEYTVRLEARFEKLLSQTKYIIEGPNGKERWTLYDDGLLLVTREEEGILRAARLPWSPRQKFSADDLRKILNSGRISETEYKEIKVAPEPCGA